MAPTKILKSIAIFFNLIVRTLRQVLSWVKGMVKMRPYEVLKQVPIFSHIEPQDLAHISKKCRIESYDPQTIIFKEGDFANKLFIMIKGEVDIIKNLGQQNEMRLRTLAAQDYFGEMALLDKYARSASVVSRIKSSALCIDGLDLKKILIKYPKISITMLQTIIKRLRNIESGMLCTLDSFLPICSGCKKIRDESDEWVTIEKYITQNSSAEFSHSICPACKESMYPDLKTSKT